MSNELTHKQIAFFKAYYDPKSDTFGNGVRSALKTYNTTDYKTASNISSENLAKPRIKQLMEAKGIGSNELLKVLEEGLTATRTISAVGGKKGNKEADGTTMDFIEVPDHATRHKFLETAGRWAKLNPDKEVEVQGEGNITVTVKDYE